MFFILLRFKKNKIGTCKNRMFNARSAGDHPYRKWLFSWLPLVMPLMVPYLCSSFSLEMS